MHSLRMRIGLLALALVACGCARSPSGEAVEDFALPRPPLEAPPESVPSAFSPNPFGLMGFPYSHARSDPQVFEKAADHMALYRLTGARWDRRDFWWGIVQPEPERWEWEYFDRAMEDFRRNQVNLVVILCYGSAWAKEAPATEEEMQRFGEYVFRMVDRYKGWVKHWEIWNEPNILPFWSPKPNVAHYARLLQIAYERAKQADPDCTILGGALAGADERFLRGMYEHGARGYFDALSYHTYGNHPTEETQRDEINCLRRVMQEYNDDKPLWLTETGIYTGPAGVSEALQAERTVKSEIRWVAMGIERIFQLTLKDWSDDPNTQDAMSFRGLTHADGTPKPLFYAHRTLCDRLASATFVGRPRLHPELDAYLFREDAQNTLVLWSEEDQAVEVTLRLFTAALLQTDLYGKRQLLVSDSGDYTLQATSAPVYLEGVGDAMLLAAGLEWLEPKPVVPGEPGRLTLTIPNPFEREIRLELSFQDTRTLRFRPATHILEIPPGEVIQEPVDFDTAPDAPAGTYDFQFLASCSPAGEQPLYGRVELANPYALSFEPYTELAMPEGSLPLRLENHSAREVEGRLRFVFSEGLDAPPVAEVRLAAGEERSFPVPIRPAQLASGGEYRFEATLEIAGVEVSAQKTVRILKALRLDTPIEMDGRLEDWQAYPKNITTDLFTEVKFNPNLLGGAEDMSVSGWLAWDEEALYLALEVRDDHLHFPVTTAVWDFDSLQVALDGANDAVENAGFDQNDFEFQIARMRTGEPLIYAIQYPEGHISSIVEEECELAIVADQATGRLVYELRIPEAVIPPLELSAGRVFGFNLIHNDNDGGRAGDREGWLELTPGIGYGKDPWQYDEVILWPE